MESVTDEQTEPEQETVAQKRQRFERLAMPAVNTLYRQAMRLTNNPEDAQDLVQDTFERGFKAFDSFQPGSNFEAWMTTIERNAYFNQYANWDIYSASEHASEGLKSAEQEYLDAFAPEEIMSALAKLSPERRQVFIDATIDGKSYRQISDEQGVKIGTVMSRLNRARAPLPEFLIPKSWSMTCRCMMRIVSTPRVAMQTNVHSLSACVHICVPIMLRNAL